MSTLRRQERSKVLRKEKTVPVEALLRSLERLADSDPSDFGFLVGRIFLMLAERERDTYDFLMVKVIFATLQESGFLARFDELKQLLVAKDVPAASGIVAAIESWTKAIETFASRKASDKIIQSLRNDYVLGHQHLSPGLLAGTELPPSNWLNKRLRDLGEKWTVSEGTKLNSKLPAVSPLQDKAARLASDTIQFLTKTKNIPEPQALSLYKESLAPRVIGVERELDKQGITESGLDESPASMAAIRRNAELASLIMDDVTDIKTISDARHMAKGIIALTADYGKLIQDRQKALLARRNHPGPQRSGVTQMNNPHQARMEAMKEVQEQILNQYKSKFHQSATSLRDALVAKLPRASTSDANSAMYISPQYGNLRQIADELTDLAQQFEKQLEAHTEARIGQ